MSNHPNNRTAELTAMALLTAAQKQGINTTTLMQDAMTILIQDNPISIDKDETGTAGAIIRQELDRLLKV